ncbi:MAG: hypothetical protein JO316_05885 [Abitibacteriaceae bacterium]|nr:hypothetical protein [Abditibacteriaceae bacterium]MBV9864859.1 hypothetical protein [Abditibacteriaceae bacterium]
MFKFHLPARKNRSLFASQTLKPVVTNNKKETVKAVVADKTQDEGSRFFAPAGVIPRKA